MSNYWEDKLKELEEEEKKRKKKRTGDIAPTAPSSSVSSTPPNYWQNKIVELEAEEKKRKQRQTTDIAPVKTVGSITQTVKNHSGGGGSFGDIAPGKEMLYQSVPTTPNATGVTRPAILSDLSGVTNEEELLARMTPAERVNYERIKGKVASGEIAERKPFKDVLTMTGHTIMSGLAAWNKGLTSTADVILGKPLQALGWENNPISSIAEYYDDQEEAWTQKRYDYINARGYKPGASDFFTNVFSSVPDALLAIMTAGASEAPTAAKLATNAASQSGNLLSKFGLTVEQMMRKPQFWTSFARTYGTDYEEAQKELTSKRVGRAEFTGEKASDGEKLLDDAKAALAATFTSLVNAGIEIGLDGMSGIQGLPSEIAEEGGSALTKWAISSLEEGGEEVLQGFVSDIVAKSMYDDDREILDLKKMGTEFAMGAGAGAVLGGGQIGVSAVDSAVQKHEANKLTENEKKVVDKLVADRIAEAEKNGEKLSKKEAKKEVVSEMERGIISTDTIEEIFDGEGYSNIKAEKEKFFGSDTYKSYIDITKSESEQIKKLENQLKELENEPNTIGNSKKYDAIQSKLEELRNSTKSAELKSQVDQELKRIYEMQNRLRDSVFELVKGDRLAESYNELARKHQAFQADLSKYDEKQQAVIQKAIDSGVLNNTNRTHEFVDLVARISADKGVLFDFTNNQKLKESGFAMDGVVRNGFVSKDGVTLNVQAAKSLNKVVGHEITHVLEGTELYNTLQETVFEYARSKGEYDSRLKAITELYNKHDPDADPVKELTADLVGDYLFTDTEFINNLSTNHRNVFQKVYDEVKYLCKVATAGSKEARQLEKVKKAFEAAYRADSKAQTEKQYSLGEIVDGNNKSYGVGVHLDSTLLDNLTPAERLGMVKEYVKELGGESFTAYDPNGNAVDITIAKPNARFKNQSGKKTLVNKDLTTKYIGNEAKQEAIALIDELIVAAEYDGSKAPQYPHGWLDNNGQNNWEYWTTYIEDKNNTIWEATLNIANTANGEKILYDISPIKKVGQSVKSDTIPTTDNIAQENPVVKRQFSLSETPLEQRLSGDALLDAQDLIAEIEGVAEISPNGYVTVYHRTTAENAKRIMENGKMSAKEDGIFFSTQKDGEYSADYGEGVVTLKVPIEKLVLDDIFDTEAHLKIPLKNRNEVLDVSAYMPDSKHSLSNVGETDTATGNYNVYGKDIALPSALEDVAPSPATKQSVNDTVNYDRDSTSQTAPMQEVETHNQSSGIKISEPWMDKIDSVVEPKSQRHYFSKSYQSYVSDVTAEIKKEIRDSVDRDVANGMSRQELLRKAAEAKLESDRLYNLADEDTTVAQDIYMACLHEQYIRYRLAASSDGMVDVSEELSAIMSEMQNPSSSALTEDVAPVAQAETATETIESTDSTDYLSPQDAQLLNVMVSNIVNIARRNNISLEQVAIATQEINAFQPTKSDARTFADALEPIVKQLNNENFYGYIDKMRSYAEQNVPIAEDVPVVDEENATTTEEIFPDNLDPIDKEIDDLAQQFVELESRLYEMAEAGQFGDEFNQLSEEWNTVKQRLEALEQEANTADADRLSSLDDADAPPEMDAPYQGESESAPVEDPFDNRDWRKVGNQKVKAYMYENPEVKPFFQEEAMKLYGELSDTTRGERWYNDRLYYESSGEKGFGGVKRHTSQSMEEMLDSWGMSYADIEKGLEAIIEDHGAENIAAAKKIEFMLNDRLLHGYKDFYTNKMVEPNQDYINLLEEKQVMEYTEEARQSFFANADKYAPMVDDDIAPTAVSEKTTDNQPVEPAATKDAHKQKGVIDGQQEFVLNDQELSERDVKIKKALERIDRKLAFDKSELDREYRLQKLELQRFGEGSIDSKLAELDKMYQSNLAKLDADAKVKRNQAKTAAQRSMVSDKKTAFWKNLIGNTSTWKDMPLGLMYKTKTLKRILRHVVRDANGKPNIKLADEIYRAIETKYDHNEALLKRESNKLKDPFAKLGLNHTEYVYAHMLGEFRHNPDTELTEDVVKDYLNKHKKIDTAKVDTAIGEARKLFDDLFERVNTALREQGFKEIPYRKGYFPHFTNPKQNWFQKLMNWKPVDNEIPTSIAGLTQQFKPQRSWQAFDKQRKSDITEYGLDQALDTYIHGALDWIYHIDDLQDRRSLENYLRYIHSDEGIKARIDEIKADESLDAEDAQKMIDGIYAEARNPLGNLVRELMNRTNTLANKKSSMDREMEEDLNRKVYSTMTNINKRINGNLVVGSLRSALANFIPIVQSWHMVSPWYTVNGLGDFVKSTIRDDGMIAKSDFLTNRLIEEEKLYQTGWDKTEEAVAFVGNVVDSITSQTVWRSKYLQNLHDGMSEVEAIRDADLYAKDLIAGRSRGNQPTIFDAKNPVTKLLTSFQLEIANQYGHMFEDVPIDSKNNARLVKGYATAMVGAYVYNAIFSALTGSDAALDPIGIIEDFLRDLGMFGDDDEEEDKTQAFLNLGKNIVQEVPFVGGYFGGGRVPISSALPYGNDSSPMQSLLADVERGWNDGNWTEGEWTGLVKEMLKPLYYVAMPVGGGQLKKTFEGLDMFLGDHPIAGSYTDSGDLRYPVDPTVGNVIQAGLFGQYASKNARAYFDPGRKPLNEKQMQEYDALDMPIQGYWDYRDEQGTITKNAESETATDDDILKSKYIGSVDSDLSEILAEKEKVLKDTSLAEWEKTAKTIELDEQFAALAKERYDSYNDVSYEDNYRGGGRYARIGDKVFKWYEPGEDSTTEPGWKILSKEELAKYETTKAAGNANYATDGTNHYYWYEPGEDSKSPAGWKKLDADQLKKQEKVTKGLGITAEEYWYKKEEYEFAYESPGKYCIANAVGGYENYKSYADVWKNFDAKDKYGNSVSGLKKKRVHDYIYGLDIDSSEKALLFMSNYPNDDDYLDDYDKHDIVNYLNSRNDISYREMETILTELGFVVDEQGNIDW